MSKSFLASLGLAVTALRAMGRDPSFLIGGRMLGLGTSAHLGETDLFVLEADDIGQIAVQGNLVDHEYRFERDGSRIAEVPSAGYGYATRSA